MDRSSTHEKKVSRAFSATLFFLMRQADRGFAKSRLCCTDEDGTIKYLVLHMVRNNTSKEGGDAPRATD
jgi:hypothetical protein